MKNVNVVLICDDGYMIPTYVTVFSIRENKSDSTRYCIHIIANTNHPEKYNAFLSLQEDAFEICLHCVTDESVNELGKSGGESFCVATPSALLKFYLPDILHGTDKVIYLDGDVIVRRDLLQLYETELGDCYIGAVKDSGRLYSGRKNVRENEAYFNSGVMLLDLNKMKGIVNDLVEAKRQQTEKTLMDQDVFNEVLIGRVLLLPLRYNLLYTNLTRAREQYTMEDLNRMFGTDYKFLQDAYHDAAVLHFSSKDKPWKSVESPMARVWHRYYRQAKRTLTENGTKTDIFTEFERNLPKDIGLANSLGAGMAHLPENGGRLIVSLTSYPARIQYAIGVIGTILKQTEVPDCIILWLTEEEIPDREKGLPEELLDLRAHGLEIRWCRNLKPHNKYLFTLKEYPEDIIITVDDDIVYEAWVLHQLYRSYVVHPDAISAMRVHAMSFDESGELKRYIDWEQETEHPLFEPRYDLLATGVGGVLYPPHALHEEATNEEEAVRYCPTTDDLWLKIMSIKCGTKTVLAYPNIKLNIITESQKTGLYRANRRGGNNDAHLRAVLDRYNELENGETIKGLLLSDYREIQEELRKPIVSVLLPICNKEAPFRKCIDSIIKQSLKGIEILILDNGTKTGTLAKYMTKDDRISVCTGNKPFGQLLNEGLRMARGKYVVIADAGTEYEDFWLKNQYLRAEQNQADIAICKMDYWDELRGDYCLNDWEKRYYKLPAASVFSFDEIKEDRFNIFTYRLDDKFYRREFLDREKICFDEEITAYTDLKFIYGSLLRAKRITFSSEIAGHLDRRQELIESELAGWDALLRSCADLCGYLEKEKLMPRYERDFKNFVLSFMLREYDFCGISELERRYESLRERDFKAYGFDKLEKAYFYHPEMYDEYQYIRTFAFNRQVLKKVISDENKNIIRIRKEKEQNKICHELKRENEYLRAENEQLKYAAYCLGEVRKSKSYKIGLAITRIPRALRRRK